jgi:hypothetical protein
MLHAPERFWWNFDHIDVADVYDNVGRPEDE